MSSSVLSCVLALAIPAADPWTPPENPDPAAILREAQEDTRSERYELALAKHVWFHQNALKHQRAQAGVRLSFALSYWKKLADAYPPALFKLMEMRDVAADAVKRGEDLTLSFHDFTAINKTLGEEARTTELFATLHADHPERAKQVYVLAQPALIKAKEYQLCMHYIDPVSASRRIRESFQTQKGFAKDSKFADQQVDFANRKFTNDAATLVALLVVNGRTAEASTVAQEVKKEWDNVAFRKAIDDALDGKVPAPWP